MGGITAIFLTDLTIMLINTYTTLNIELDSRESAGVGFFLGHVGMEGITALILKAKDIFKKKDK